LGAVKFDPFTPDAFGDSLYLRIDVDEQLALGREVQEDTLAWWSNQAEDVREEALGEGNRVGLESMYRQLNRFTVGAENIWCQGPAFDIVILENYIDNRVGLLPGSFGKYVIVVHYLVYTVIPREKNKAGLHNALEDCVSQAQGVQAIYHALTIRKAYLRTSNGKSIMQIIWNRGSRKFKKQSNCVRIRNIFSKRSNHHRLLCSSSGTSISRYCTIRKSKNYTKPL
jgi:hypothetical protein